MKKVRVSNPKEKDPKKKVSLVDENVAEILIKRYGFKETK